MFSLLPGAVLCFPPYPMCVQSADARNMVRDQATEDELAHLAAERERRKAREAAAAEAAAAERA